jgi:undecaprenyl-diphosphatase
LSYGAVWGYRFAAVQLGPFTPLAVVLLVAVLIAVLGPVLLIHYHTQLRAALGRIFGWLGRLLAATGLPQAFARRYPRLARFLVARFTLGSPTGLALTLTVAIALALLEQVVELLVEAVSGSPVVSLDHRITNLVATMRSAELDQVMYAVTALGSLSVVAALAAAAILIALLARRWREALLLLLAVAASRLSVAGLQLLVARPRPPLADARIVQTGFSFPSSHAAIAATFYGAIAYLLIRRPHHEALKIVAAVLAALLVLLIGVSRGYLGVHFPSDILAGWVVGALWLALLVIADLLWQAHVSPKALKPLAPPRRALSIGGTIILGLAAAAYAATAVGDAALQVPAAPQPPPVAPVVVAADEVPDTVVQQLPHYTEGLTGDRQEPVSLIFVATQARLEGAFSAAGWTEAQRFGFGAAAGGIRAALTHHTDPAGPVTPSFLAEQPNALGFSLPVGTTFAERHHIRIWRTTVQTSAGQPIWMATASFDRGFELANFLPTHQIAPDIDTERAFVVDGLQSAGTVADQETIQLVPSEQGHNFNGDPFFTDGQTVILALR